MWIRDSLRYVQHVSELKNPDMIILPGTKNTMEDLLWMRANCLEAAVLKEAAKGKIIFGICGGYQMLGETLDVYKRQAHRPHITLLGIGMGSQKLLTVQGKNSLDQADLLILSLIHI